MLRSGGRRKSLKSLDSGHKLRLDLTTGCLIVKRKKSYLSNIWDLGKKYIFPDMRDIILFRCEMYAISARTTNCRP